jgi:hypothetical protein
MGRQRLDGESCNTKLGSLVQCRHGPGEHSKSARQTQIGPLVRLQRGASCSASLLATGTPGPPCILAAFHRFNRHDLSPSIHRLTPPLWAAARSHSILLPEPLSMTGPTKHRLHAWWDRACSFLRAWMIENPTWRVIGKIPVRTRL